MVRELVYFYESGLLEYNYGVKFSFFRLISDKFRKQIMRILKKVSQTFIVLSAGALLYPDSPLSSDHKNELSPKKTWKEKQFEKWDQDKSGTLSADEMLEMITTSKNNGGRWEEKWGTPQTQTKGRIRKRDVDGDGELSLEEFTAKVTWN